MQFRDTIIEILERQGWLKDPRRMGWFNPTSHEFVSSERVDELDRLYTLVDGAHRAQPQIVVGTNLTPSTVHHTTPHTVLPHTVSPTHDPASNSWSGYPDEFALKVRMGIRPTLTFPWSSVQIIRGKNRITVVVAAEGGDRVVTIEDDINLFPSDELIGKLRLLQP